MPVVFGEMVTTVEDITALLARYGNRVRGTYRAHYRFAPGMRDPYGAAPRLERPESLASDPNGPYPWEQIFLAAATCAGSDYPMLAAHYGIALEQVDFVVEGTFDPGGEFTGLGGFEAPADARHCFLSLVCRATLVSDASLDQLRQLHDRVIAYNMVLGALRGIPRSSELAIVPGVRVGGGTIQG
jgi:hypothetical protein